MKGKNVKEQNEKRKEIDHSLHLVISPIAQQQEPSLVKVSQPHLEKHVAMEE